MFKCKGSAFDLKAEGAMFACIKYLVLVMPVKRRLFDHR